MNTKVICITLLSALASLINIQSSYAQEFSISVTPSNSEFQPAGVEGDWHIVQSGTSFASTYNLPEGTTSEPTKTILNDSTYYLEEVITEYDFVGFRIGNSSQNYNTEQLQETLMTTQDSQVSITAVCSETSTTRRTNYRNDAIVGDPDVVNSNSRTFTSSNTVSIHFYELPVFTSSMPLNDSKVVWSSSNAETFTYATNGGGQWNVDLYYQVNDGSRHNASNGTLSVPLSCNSGSSSIVVTMEIKCTAPDGTTDWTPRNAKEQRTCTFTVWSIPNASRENTLEEYTYVFNGRTLTLAPSLTNGDDNAWSFSWTTNIGEESTDSKKFDVSTSNGRLKEAVSGRTANTITVTATNNPVGIDEPKTFTFQYSIYTMPEPVAELKENDFFGYPDSKFDLNLTVTDSNPAYYPTGSNQQSTPICYYIQAGKRYNLTSTSPSENGSTTYSTTITPSLAEGSEIITVYWGRQLRHTEGYYIESCQLYEFQKEINLRLFSKGSLDKSGNNTVNIYGDATPCEGQVWNAKVLYPSVIGGYPEGWTFLWKEISDPSNVITLSNQPNDNTNITVTANNDSGQEKSAKLRLIASNAISPSILGNTDSVDYTIRIFPKATTSINFESDMLVNRYYGDSETLRVDNNGGSSNWNFHWRTTELSNNLDNSDGNINGVKSYKSSTKAASDTEPDQAVTRTLIVNNFSPDGTELWYEQVYEYPIHLWSKGNLTKSSDYNEYLYGGTHSNETRIRASIQGGYEDGYDITCTILDGFEFVELYEISKKDSLVYNVIATNRSGQEKTARIRINWKNEIDSNHKGNSGSFDYTIHISPGASQIPEPMVGWTNDNESNPEVVRDVDVKELSLTPGIGGSQWVYEWYVDDQLVDRGSYYGKYFDLADTSDRMNITNKVLSVHWYNLASNGAIMEEGTSIQYLKIYNTPKTPFDLQKKGDGHSNIYIAYVDNISDQQLFSDEYAYTFQFGDGSTTAGAEEETTQRWHQYGTSPSNPWVRTCWHYPDYDCYSEAVGINGMTRSISSIELINNDINNSYLILTLNGSLVKMASTDEVSQLDLRPGMYIIKDSRNGQCKKISVK